MQIDNSFNKHSTDSSTVKDEPSPFHKELQIQPLTFNPQTDGASVIQARGELGRIEQANGGPPPHYGLIVTDPPRADFHSPDAVVTSGADGIPVLHPYPGQARLRYYPGGKGTPEQVAEARKIISRLPGPAEPLFELFDKTYNSREGENHTPGALKLDDAPNFGPNAGYQVHFDVDMYVREDHGPGMNARDLRPTNDVAPGSGKRPDNFYAVVSDKRNGNRPLDVLVYDDPGTGSHYKGQYIFQYKNNPDGTSVTTVNHFVPPDVATGNAMIGKDVLIANKQNELIGTTRYYYDAQHRCIEADAYRGSDLKQPNPQPFTKMRFVDGQVNGTITERQQATQFDFFDLLGPRLPD
jgi:hypothetical protein